MTRYKLAAQLERDEELRLHMYQDSRGVWTIGYGHNLMARPITRLVADVLLRADMAATEDEVIASVPWASSLSSARYGVLLNMAYQMGAGGLLTFEKFLRHVQAHQWEDAAREMLDSDWHRQTPRRAERLAEQMRTGEWAS